MQHVVDSPACKHQSRHVMLATCISWPAGACHLSSQQRWPACASYNCSQHEGRMPGVESHGRQQAEGPRGQLAGGPE